MRRTSSASIGMMRHMDPASLIVLALVVFGALQGYRYLRNKKRKEAAISAAAARGYRVVVDRAAVPFSGFDLLRKGDSRHISMRFTRPEDRNTVFEFTYKVRRSDGDGGHRTSTYHHTCAVVTLPFRAPHTTIGREGLFSKLARAVGRRDIEVESERFNKRFKVDSDDERFAVTLLDGAAINWFLDEQGYASTSDYELRDDLMLIEVSGRLDPNAMLDYLEWAVTVPERFPRVLQTLYNKA
jgi:hypothetical protein